MAFKNTRSLRFITYLTIVGIFLKVPAAKSRVSKKCWVTERSLKTRANVCQVSKIRNQINPEKQSEMTLSSWHVR